MKKLALLIAILTIFTSTAFAQIDVTVEGSSELTLGIALDDPTAVGFKNDNSSKISFNLADGTSEKGGEADVYGWIEIKEWKAEVNSDDGYKDLAAGDVTAKIMFNGGWVKISSSNTETNLTAPAILNEKDYKGVAVDVGGAGFVLGLDMAPATIELGISTPNDWLNETAPNTGTDYDWVDHDENDATEPVWMIVDNSVADAANTEPTFGTHLQVTLDIAPLTVVLAGVTDLNPNSKVGVGAKISADVAPLTVSVAGDVALDTVADTNNYEAVLDLSVALAEGMTLAAIASYSSIDNFDAVVDFDATIDAIGLGLYFMGADLDATMHYIIEFDASYTTDTIKPYLTVGYGDISAADDDGIRTLEGAIATNLKVGCEAYIIENVVLKAEWAADPLGDTNGNITFSSKISY